MRTKARKLPEPRNIPGVCKRTFEEPFEVDAEDFPGVYLEHIVNVEIDLGEFLDHKITLDQRLQKIVAIHYPIAPPCPENELAIDWIFRYGNVTTETKLKIQPNGCVSCRFGNSSSRLTQAKNKVYLSRLVSYIIGMPVFLREQNMGRIDLEYDEVDFAIDCLFNIPAPFLDVGQLGYMVRYEVDREDLSQFYSELRKLRKKLTKCVFEFGDKFSDT